VKTTVDARAYSLSRGIKSACVWLHGVHRVCVQISAILSAPNLDFVIVVRLLTLLEPCRLFVVLCARFSASTEAVRACLSQEVCVSFRLTCIAGSCVLAIWRVMSQWSPEHVEWCTRDSNTCRDNACTCARWCAVFVCCHVCAFVCIGVRALSLKCSSVCDLAVVFVARALPLIPRALSAHSGAGGCWQAQIQPAFVAGCRYCQCLDLVVLRVS
jgi:hypothetical protein